MCVKTSNQNHHLSIHLLRDKHYRSNKLNKLNKHQQGQHRFASRAKGFTLIESIIAMVTLSFAMLVLSQFLFPQVEKSAIPYYQARASALGNAVMGEILGRMFDQQSDPSSQYRCGESAYRVCNLPAAFGTTLSEAPTVSSGTASFTAVDSYLLNPDGSTPDLGCWGSTTLCSPYLSRGDIVELLPGASDSDYANFAVVIDVFYESYTAGSGFAGSASATQTEHKRITVTVLTEQYGDYEFVAYRSNY